MTNEKKLIEGIHAIREKALDYGYSNDISVRKVLRWLDEIESGTA